MGRLIDQVTSEASSAVQGIRLKQASLRQKEQQIQQLRSQVQPMEPFTVPELKGP